MKRTKYITLTRWSMENTTYQRVYEDNEGKFYIRTNGEYKCIENLPCRKYVSIGNL